MATRLPLTRLKLLAARALRAAVRPFAPAPRRVVTRRGVTYELDLDEAIDLSLFLFGGFQSHLVEGPLVPLPADGVVLDVGANVGSLALRFARRVAAGRVYAFEPTHYAFGKLTRNLALNPELAPRVVAVQTFVSAHAGAPPAAGAYASWSVAPGAGAGHPLHGGTFRSAEGVGAVALDDFCRANGLARVDLLKIDTDGHELDVLEGARETLARHRPAVLFEAGQYLLEERGTRFERFFDLFEPLGYALVDASRGRPVTRETWPRRIPRRATVDVLARPVRPLSGT